MGEKGRRENSLQMLMGDLAGLIGTAPEDATASKCFRLVVLTAFQNAVVRKPALDHHKKLLGAYVDLRYWLVGHDRKKVDPTMINIEDDWRRLAINDYVGLLNQAGERTRSEAIEDNHWSPAIQWFGKNRMCVRAFVSIAKMWNVPVEDLGAVEDFDEECLRVIGWLRCDWSIFD